MNTQKKINGLITKEMKERFSRMTKLEQEEFLTSLLIKVLSDNRTLTQ